MKETGIILIINKSITSYVPGTVLSVGDNGEVSGGGQDRRMLPSWGLNSLVRDRLDKSY